MKGINHKLKSQLNLWYKGLQERPEKNRPPGKPFGSGGDRKLKFRKLYGIVVATVTPLTGDGKLNLEALGLL